LAEAFCVRRVKERSELYGLPAMMFDHKVIVTEALLKEKFALPEIHSLYETIPGKHQIPYIVKKLP
jgi:hypothetical protein